MFGSRATAMFEGLNWMLVREHSEVIIESDSLLSMQAICCSSENLEVGHVFVSCRNILRLKHDFFLSFVKRQANGTTHVMARFFFH